MTTKTSIQAAEDIIRQIMEAGLFVPEMSQGDEKTYRIRDDFLNDPIVYDNLRKWRPDLIPYLLPWCNNTMIVERKHILRIKYPVVNNEILDETTVYELDIKVMGNFWFHKLYTMNADTKGYEMCERIGGGFFEFELPGERNTKDDGQLKIMTDAILAVDSIQDQDNIKVCVVGGGGMAGTFSGLSYEAVAIMITNSIIDVFDPNGVNGSFFIGNNKVNVYASRYDYKNTLYYDLVLDDSWVEDEIKEDIEGYEKVYETKDYSVKIFPWESKYKGIRYKQLFKTNGKEERAVSRKIEYNYTNRPLGNCAACVEIKYLLKRKYDDLLYKIYLSAHKRNCMTNEERKIIVGEKLKVEFVRVKEISEAVKNKILKLPWDIGLRGKEIYLNPMMLRASVIEVSDPHYCTNMILALAGLVLWKKENQWMAYGQLSKFMLEIESDVKVVIYERKMEEMSYHKKVRKKEEIKDYTPLCLSDDYEGEVGIVFRMIQITVTMFDVGYRKIIKKAADEFKVYGVVNNTINHIVQVKFQGEVNNCMKFEAWIKKTKPPKGRVVKIVCENDSCRERFSDFIIR